MATNNKRGKKRGGRGGGGGFFRSSAKNIGGRFTAEDWYFTAAIIALAFLFLWLINNYKPFIAAPVSVFQ